MSRLPSLRTATVLVVALGMVGVAALAAQPPGPVRLDSDAGAQRAAQDTPLGKIEFHPVALTDQNKPTPRTLSHPREMALTAAGSKVFDVRALKSTVIRLERPEPGEPTVESDGADPDAQPADPDAQPADPDAQPPDPDQELPTTVNTGSFSQGQTSNAPAPAPNTSFDGLDFTNWGAGHPPDDNGDVGPTYYIQTINSSLGIYQKSNGSRVAAFTFNSFMSQGNFGNLCDTNNFGDPVVLYDTYEDRWFITDFAFVIDGSGNVNPQTVFQCFAVSKTGDPVNGGWNFYSILDPGGLADYPKFGVWPDGIYMSANMFGYAAGASYFGYHVWALNKQQMYDGAPSVQVVDFAGDTSDFTVIPANSRLQVGTPPAGSPEYFVSTEQFLNALSIYKFQVDWDKVSTSTFTGPFTQLEPNCWPNGTPANASTPANSADVLAIRAMAQAQYTNLGGAESLWVDHTVQRGVSATNTTCNATTGGNASVRWYQANVTGGTVAANVAQGATYDPEGANTFYRYMPALGVDRAGDMAVVYSKSNSTTNPQIKYAGRLAGDPANSLAQTEQTLLDGAGSQSGNCGPSACLRWGDYSGMALDPNGCAFWMTDEYLAVSGLNTLTRIGSFAYPSCTTIGTGTLSGTVTDGSSPIVGATVRLGSRTATTDGSGHYSFTVPAGTYPNESAAKAGFNTATDATLVVPNGGTLTKNLTLSAAAQSGCFTDNTQSTFQRGVPANCSLTASPNNVVLSNSDNTDAKNSSVTGNGFSFTNTSWVGQTFTPTVTGQLKRIEIELFCSGCSGSNPDITVSIRSTTGSPAVPTGADLASATLTGFNDGGAGGLKTVTFGSPPTLISGTRYALIVRATAARTGLYAYTCSCTPDSNPYASGQRVTSANSGSTWTADTTVGGRDLNFVTYINPGYASLGTFISSLKDANPAAGSTVTWTTLTFNATTPANTGVKLQVAASNSDTGPFNFVGPDGTTNTFFTTSGASLSQFNGFRYLKYKAILTTSSGSATPSLASVQICFNDVGASAATALAVSPASGTFGGTVNLSATLTSSATPVAGKSVSFTLNGTSVGSALTNASGIATLNNVSLSGINAGSNPTGVGASFAGDGSYSASSGSAALTVAQASQSITVNTHAPASAAYNAGFTVAATAPGGTVSYSSSGACTNVGATFTMTSATGSCSVMYDQTGNTNYSAAPQVVETVTATKASQTITVTTHAPASAANGASFGVTATAPGGSVSYSAAGSCSNVGSTFTMTSASGTCTVMYDQAGDVSYNAAPQVTESVTATSGSVSTTTSVVSSVNPSMFSQSIAFSATVSGGSTPTGTVQFKIGGVDFGSPVALDGSGKAVSAATTTLAVGSHTVSAVYSGDSGHLTSTGSVSQTVKKASVMVAVSSDHNPGTKGTSITFTVTVTFVSPATKTPGGKVKLFRNGTQIGTKKALSGGKVSWTITWKAGTGTFNMTAKYLGNASFNAATSPIFAQVITT